MCLDYGKGRPPRLCRQHRLGSRLSLEEGREGRAQECRTGGWLFNEPKNPRIIFVSPGGAKNHKPIALQLYSIHARWKISLHSTGHTHTHRHTKLKSHTHSRGRKTESEKYAIKRNAKHTVYGRGNAPPPYRARSQRGGAWVFISVCCWLNKSQHWESLGAKSIQPSINHTKHS